MEADGILVLQLSPSPSLGALLQSTVAIMIIMVLCFLGFLLFAIKTTTTSKNKERSAETIATRSGQHKSDAPPPPPPPGPSFKQFGAHMVKMDAAYWLNDWFRQQEQEGQGQEEENKNQNHCRAVELETDVVTRMIIGGRFFVVSDYRTARKILESNVVTKWPLALRFFADTSSGENIITEHQNGPRWKHVRKATVGAFSPNNLRLIVSQIDEIMDRWMEQKLASFATQKNHQAFQVLPEMNYLTAQIILSAGFDYVVNEEECREFLTNMDIAVYEFGTASIQSTFLQLELTRWLFTSYQNGKAAATKLYEFATKVLHKYRSPTTTKKPHMLIDMIDRDQEFASDKERITEICAYVVAGFGTTANTLALALKELAQNPREQEQLREKLREYGTDMEGARSCPALKHVVREVTRLHPAAASGSIRVTGDKGVPVVDTPYEIPPKSIVMMPFYVIHRDSSVFEDPDEFKPSRWENATEEMKRCLIPFSAGRRSCMGQGLVSVESHTIISRIISNYEIRIAEAGTLECPNLHAPKGLTVTAHPVPPTPPLVTANKQEVGKQW